MIQKLKNLGDLGKLQAWLEREVREKLRPDVSNYAKGRLRAWLRVEPSLTTPTTLSEGLPVSEVNWKRLQEMADWEFDYCLVTYSGDEGHVVGIAPHRDAAFTGYEARGLNISGECLFSYWMGRPGYDSRSTHNKYVIDRARPGLVLLEGKPVEPTHKLILSPGDLVKFNCKDPHSADPEAGRWCLNLWKRKPEV